MSFWNSAIIAPNTAIAPPMYATAMFPCSGNTRYSPYTPVFVVNTHRNTLAAMCGRG